VAKVLLDSTTYMDLEKAPKFRFHDWAVTSVKNVILYRRTNGNPFLSVVSVAEILRGLHRDVDSSKVITFKQNVPLNFEFLNVTSEISYLASEILAQLDKEGLAIGFPDSLIAATAIHHGFDLVTSNERHFRRVVDLGYPLTLRNWREA